jgi:integrase
MQLTNTLLKAMVPGQTIFDDVVTGLHARAFPNRVSFYLHYRSKEGVERRPKLDDWGNITLVQARDAARALRAEIAAGRDPVADRQKAKAEPTVQQLFDKAWDDYFKRRKTAKEIRRLFDCHVAPRVGGRRVSAVDFGDIGRIHGALADTPYQANRVHSLLTRLFNLAERPYNWRASGSNPCRGVERYPELKRKRKADPDELAAIGPILERKAAEGQARSVAHLYLLAFSGARPMEIAKATWEQLSRLEVNGALYGRLDIDDGKTGQISVFLPPQAMAVIDSLPRVQGQTITGIQSPRKLWEAVRLEAGCPDLRMRDWRRTFASVALSSGVPIGQVGELLNHKNVSTTATYAKLLDAPAREAAAATATVLETMMRAGTDAKPLAPKTTTTTA